MLKKNNKHWLIVILATCLFVLTGCFHDDDDNASTNANPTGYYDETGTASVKQDDNMTDLVISDLQGIIQGNQFKAMSMAEDLLYDGKITSISDNNFRATTTIFREGEIIGTATINGAITEGSSVTGTLTGTGAGNGTFNLVFAQSNNQLADISNIELMTWYSVLASFFRNFEFNIASGGEIDVTFSTNVSIFDGCLVDLAAPTSPEFEVIADTSLYQVNLTLASCTTPTVDGVYVGLASVLASNSMAIMISNDTYAMYSIFDPG